MALLFMDGFDTADYATKWIYPGGNLASSTTTRFGTGRSIAFGGASTSGTLQKSFTAVSQIFAGIAVSSTSYGNGHFLRLFGDSGATQHLGLQFVNATTLGLFRGSTQIATATVPNMAGGAWLYVEIMGTLSDTVGTCKVRVDGTEVINFSGDTKNAGTNSTIDAVILGSWTGHTVDDFYICDSSGGAPYNTFLGDVRVVTLSPTAAGSSTQLTPDTGSNYARVNEIPYSASNYVSGSTPGLRDTYTIGDLPAGVATVHAVQHNIIAKRTSTGAIAVKPAIKSGASVYYGTTTSMTTSDVTISDLRITDPNTAAAWTVSGVNALESGLEIA